MPVQRFRSIEDMGRAPVLARRAEGFDRFVRLCARMRRLSGRRYPRGVFRFRSVEEAQAARLAHALPDPSLPTRTQGDPEGVRRLRG